MEKFIPYEKRSKKEKKALDRLRRGSWGELKPVTRRPENPKAYNRRKAHRWEDPHGCAFCFLGGCAAAVRSILDRFAFPCYTAVDELDVCVKRSRF